jgi:hypothetical protein
MVGTFVSTIILSLHVPRHTPGICLFTSSSKLIPLRVSRLFGRPGWGALLFDRLAAAAAVVVVAAAAAAQAVAVAVAVAAAAEEQNQNDDPPAATVTPRVVTHKSLPPSEFVTAFAVHSMLFPKRKKVHLHQKKENTHIPKQGDIKPVKMHKGVFCQLSIMLIMHKQ